MGNVYLKRVFSEAAVYVTNFNPRIEKYYKKLESKKGKMKAYSISSGIPNIEFDNLLATYDCMGSLSENGCLNTNGPVSIGNVEEIKIMIKMIEQLNP